MTRTWQILLILMFIVGLGWPNKVAAQNDNLDSLRLVVQELVADTTELSEATRRVLSAYLYQAQSASSSEDIIYAYQQLAALNYKLGDVRQSLKFYKLYVVELEELTEFEEYREEEFEKNLYENEIRALKIRIEELEGETKLLQETIATTYEQNYWIYLGLRVTLILGTLLLIGWGYQRYKKRKNPRTPVTENRSDHEELTNLLNQAKADLIAAQTELTLSDILVQNDIAQPDDYFKENKSLRKKFLISQPKGLSSGAGLYFHTIKQQTVIVAFESPSTGAAGGLLVSSIYHQVDEIIKRLGITSPSLILKEIEDRLEAIFPAGVPFSGGVACAVCLYDNSAKSLTYNGANYALFESYNGEINSYKGSEKSLLNDAGIADHQNLTIDCNKGKCFYLSTKAYWNQTGGHEYRPFGETAFKATLSSIHKQSVEQQNQILAKVYNEWRGGNDQEGDLLVLGFIV